MINLQVFFTNTKTLIKTSLLHFIKNIHSCARAVWRCIQFSDPFILAQICIFWAACCKGNTINTFSSFCSSSQPPKRQHNRGGLREKPCEVVSPPGTHTYAHANSVTMRHPSGAVDVTGGTWVSSQPKPIKVDGIGPLVNTWWLALTHTGGSCKEPAEERDQKPLSDHLLPSKQTCFWIWRPNLESAVECDDTVRWGAD